MNPQTFIAAIGSIPLFSLDGQTFIQMIPQLLNFALVAYILTKLLYNPVNRILQKRADQVMSDLESAAADKASAEKMKTEYEQKVREIEHERSLILEEARKQAVARRDQILEEAKTEAQELKSRATRDIASERDRVKSEVHQAIVDISADMAAKLVAVTIDKNAHEKLFAEAMEELETTAFRPLEHAV